MEMVVADLHSSTHQLADASAAMVAWWQMLKTPTHAMRGKGSSVLPAGSARYTRLRLPGRCEGRGGTNGVEGNPSERPRQYSIKGKIERLLSAW